MRKWLPALVLGLVALTASPAWAQGGGGVIIGANFANIEFTGSDEPNWDRRLGLVGGVFVTMPLGSSFSVQPEVLYSQKGAKAKEGGDELTLELDYLDIPVLARVTAGGPTGLVLFGGPSFGFKLRARSKVDVEGTKEETDIGNDVETFDLGLVIGAGVQSRSVLFDARYQWGLSNINKDEFDATEVKNRVFSVLLGFRF